MNLRAILLLACVAAALAAEESCVGRCDSGFDRQKKCQCDSMCGYYGSCCVDYETTCSHKVTRGDTFHDPDYDTDVQNTTTTTDPGNTTFPPRNSTSPPSTSTSPPRFSTVGPSTSSLRPRFSTVGPSTSSLRPRFSTLGPRTPSVWPTSTPAYAPTTPWPPQPSDPDADACNGRAFDSFMQLKNGSIYAFRGKYFFELDEKSVLPGYPKLIKDVWGISGPIDAAFTRINCQGKTYIFKGNKYWRFEDGVLDDDFPRYISQGFKNIIPNDVDAAFAIPASSHRGKEKVYFFKGERYYEYEFKHQPTHEECVQMSKDSPSILFHHYTDLYCDQWTDVFDLLFQGMQGDHSGPRLIRKDWGIRPPVDAVMAGRLYLTPVASSPQPAPSPTPSPTPISWHYPGHTYKRPSRGRKRGRGRGHGQRRRQKRLAMWELFDIFVDDYDESLEVATVTEKPMASQPVQNVYFFTKDKYYRVDLKTKKVAYAYPPYPRSIGKYWLGCKEYVSQAEK